AARGGPRSGLAHFRQSQYRRDRDVPARPGRRWLFPHAVSLPPPPAARLRAGQRLVDGSNQVPVLTVLDAARRGAPRRPPGRPLGSPSFPSPAPGRAPPSFPLPRPAERLRLSLSRARPSASVFPS